MGASEVFPFPRRGMAVKVGNVSKLGIENCEVCESGSSHKARLLYSTIADMVAYRWQAVARGSYPEAVLLEILALPSMGFQSRLQSNVGPR